MINIRKIEPNNLNMVKITAPYGVIDLKDNRWYSEVEDYEKNQDNYAECDQDHNIIEQQ